MTLRLHHGGEFLKNKYTGGLQYVHEDMDLDLFSYSVLMEWVKDLNYTEIGGIYVKGEDGGWKLVSDDAAVGECIKQKMVDGELDLFVDCIVDKEIAPMKQMQPHVIVRPRTSIFQAKAKNQGKRKFVTIKDINQEKERRKSSRIKSDCNVVASPTKGGVTFKARTDDAKGDRLLGMNEFMMMFKDTPIVSDQETPQGEVSANDNEQHSESGLQYEMERIRRIEENKRKIKELGIVSKVDMLTGKKKDKGKRLKNVGESASSFQGPDRDEATSKVNFLLYLILYIFFRQYIV